MSEKDVKVRRVVWKTTKKKLKSGGKSYKNYYNQTVPAKKPPKEEVGIEQLRIMTAILLVVANDIFNEIGQKYLVSGHSYLSCDRDVAQIEKKERID